MKTIKNRPSVMIPGTFIKAILFSLFLVAFALTPYWSLASSPSLQLLLLMVTLAGGIVWSTGSGVEIKVNFDLKGWAFFAVLVVYLFILYYQAVAIDIHWRGDESHHIGIILLVLEKILVLKKWIIPGLLLASFFLALSWVKPRLAVGIGGLILLGLVLIHLGINPFQNTDPNYILRYPLFSYWFAAFIPAIASNLFNPYHEAIFRAIPFLFACATAWIFQQKLSPPDPVTRLLAGISVATVPLVAYYATIFYLELPAVFLMTAALHNIRELLYMDAAQMRKNLGWYCLILVGLIKETVLPFLFIYVMFRWGVQFLFKRPWRSSQARNGNHRVNQQKSTLTSFIFHEFSITFSVLFPILFYVFLRSAMGTVRSYGFQWENLFDIRPYIAFGKSFIEQFGLYFLFFIAGCILLVRKKAYTTVGILLAIFLGIPVFHIIDYSGYAGYSRFNLFIFPVILVGAHTFFRWLTERSNAIVMGVTSFVILINLIQSPINIDGTKIRGEPNYPYRTAISWLAGTYPEERVLVAGLNFGYAFNFYEKRFNWYQETVYFRNAELKSDTEALADALKMAEQENYQIVLFHPLENQVPQILTASTFRQEMVFRNESRVLIIYHRIEPKPYLLSVGYLANQPQPT